MIVESMQLIIEDWSAGLLVPTVTDMIFTKKASSYGDISAISDHVLKHG